MINSDFPPVFGPKTASEVIGLKLPTIRKHIANRTIPFYRLGGSILFRYEELIEWFNSHKVKTIDEL